MTNSLSPWLDRLHPQGDYFVASDVGIYWRLTVPELDGAISPDWYYVPNVPRLRDGIPRRSYVSWVEVEAPVVVVEVVSRDGRIEHDRTPETGKFWIYEHAVRAPYYFIHSFQVNELEAYELVRGRYRRIEPNKNGRILISEMELEIGLWEGPHRGYTAGWLRAWNQEGKLLPTSEEARKAAQDQVELEQQKSAKLAQRLRELGVDPESIG